MDGEGYHNGVGDLPMWGTDPAMASGLGDDERDRTGANGGERITGAGGVSLSDGNANLQGLDVAAASTDTNPRCAIGPTSVEQLEEAGTVAGPPTPFMATDGVVEVGGEESAFAQWKVEW